MFFQKGRGVQVNLVITHQDECPYTVLLRERQFCHFLKFPLRRKEPFSVGEQLKVSFPFYSHQKLWAGNILYWSVALMCPDEGRGGIKAAVLWVCRRDLIRVIRQGYR